MARAFLPRRHCVARLAGRAGRVAALAIHSDQTLSNGGQHVKANDVSFRVTHAALPVIDRARETLSTAINVFCQFEMCPARRVDSWRIIPLFLRC
jgi:hypothetical protein